MKKNTLKTWIYLFILVIVCVLLTGCPVDQGYSIRIINNSSRTIYACAEYILPDTLLPVNKPYLAEIKPNKEGELHGFHFNDNAFKRLQKERLTIFILDKEQVNTYSWEYLRENNIVLKRYEGNAKEFPHDNGLSIHYP